jgi:hypothetical protein
LLGLMLLAAGPDAWAHKMIAAARVRDDGTVLVQAFFPDGRPARGVATEVTRPDGSAFLSSKTDDAGKLVVTPHGAAGQWTATFTGSMGHKTSVSFEIEAPAPPKPVQAPPVTAPEPVVLPEAPPEPEPAAPRPAPLADDDLIAPEPTPWDSILAGLGFISGLSALLLYLKLREEVRRMAARRTEEEERDT